MYDIECVNKIHGQEHLTHYVPDFWLWEFRDLEFINFRKKLLQVSIRHKFLKNVDIGSIFINLGYLGDALAVIELSKNFYLVSYLAHYLCLKLRLFDNFECKTFEHIALFIYQIDFGSEPITNLPLKAKRLRTITVDRVHFEALLYFLACPHWLYSLLDNIFCLCIWLHNSDSDLVYISREDKFLELNPIFILNDIEVGVLYIQIK